MLTGSLSAKRSTGPGEIPLYPTVLMFTPFASSRFIGAIRNDVFEGVSECIPGNAEGLVHLFPGCALHTLESAGMTRPVPAGVRKCLRFMAFPMEVQR